MRIRFLDRVLVVLAGTLAVSAAVTLIRNGPQMAKFLLPPEPVHAVEDWERFLGDAPRLGREDARITIVEVFDYACMACRSSQPILEAALHEHPSDLSIVIRNLHRSESRLAALGALCANRQGYFPKYHRALLLADISVLRDGETGLLSLASDAGVPDTTALKDCMASQKVSAALEADSTMAMAVGAQWTPSFIVDGQLYVPSQRDLKRLIKRVLRSDTSQ